MTKWSELNPATALGLGDQIAAINGGETKRVTLQLLRDFLRGASGDDIAVDALNGGPLSGNLNKFINGDFGIAARGISFATPGAGDFTLDRWGVGVTGASGIAYTVSRQVFAAGQADVPGDPQFHYRWDHTTAGSATELYAFQRIENVRTLAGRQCTLSFWAKADAARTVTPRWTQNFGSGGSADVTANIAACNLTSAWRKFTRTFTPTSISGKTVGAGDFLKIDLLLPVGAVMTIDLADAQLEAGAKATPFARRHPGQELVFCQRYFCKSFPQDTAPAQNTATGSILRSLANDAGRFEIPFFMPATMRAAPTVTLFNPFAANANVYNADDGTDTPGAATIADSHVMVRVAVLDATDANDTMVVHLTCDAEL